MVTELAGFPGSQNNGAHAINEHGQIVGFSASPETHAVLWDGDSITDLGDLPFCGGIDRSEANDINDLGQVVGEANAETGRRAFLWEAGSMTNLGSLPGIPDISIAHAINNDGLVVGRAGQGHLARAFLWENESGIHNLSDFA